MELIDRYIYAVTEHLPENIRVDVSKELLANIEDMLSDTPSEDEIKEVLKKLGNPRRLSYEYNPNKRYLIGPELYDNYISVLKLILSIVTTVLVFLVMFSKIFDNPVNGTIVQISVTYIKDLITTIIESIFQVFLWVTVVFAIIERRKIKTEKISFLDKEWSFNDLPKISISNEKKISRRKAVTSMCFTIFFTAVLYFNPEIIGLYIKHNNINLQIPLFDASRLHAYMPIIFIFVILQLGLFIWKSISGYWTIPLAVANGLCNAALCIFIAVMFSDISLFNAEFAAKLSLYTKSVITITKLSCAFIVIFIVGNLCDSFYTFTKCKK